MAPFLGFEQEWTSLIASSTVNMAFEFKKWLSLTVALLPAFLVLDVGGSSPSLIQWRSLGQITVRDGQEYSCKCYPGDDCYPTAKKWQTLNSTVEGKLQVAFPPAAPCYASVAGVSTFDANKCADVQANFMDEQWT